MSCFLTLSKLNDCITLSSLYAQTSRTIWPICVQIHCIYYRYHIIHFSLTIIFISIDVMIDKTRICNVVSVNHTTTCLLNNMEPHLYVHCTYTWTAGCWLRWLDLLSHEDATWTFQWVACQEEPILGALEILFSMVAPETQYNFLLMQSYFKRRIGIITSLVATNIKLINLTCHRKLPCMHIIKIPHIQMWWVRNRQWCKLDLYRTSSKIRPPPFFNTSSSPEWGAPPPHSTWEKTSFYMYYEYEQWQQL